VSDLRGAKPYASRARRFGDATIEKNDEVDVVDVESDSSSSEGYARAHGLTNDEQQPAVYISDNDDPHTMGTTEDLSAWFKMNSNDRAKAKLKETSANGR